MEVLCFNTQHLTLKIPLPLDREEGEGGKRRKKRKKEKGKEENETQSHCLPAGCYPTRFYRLAVCSFVLKRQINLTLYLSVREGRIAIFSARYKNTGQRRSHLCFFLSHS